jgi:hypothetical protein
MAAAIQTLQKNGVITAIQVSQLESLFSVNTVRALVYPLTQFDGWKEQVEEPKCG